MTFTQVSRYGGLSNHDLRRLVEYLAHANRWDELEEVLTDFEFIEEKCYRGLLDSLKGDFELALRDHPARQRKAADQKHHRSVLSGYVQQLVHYAADCYRRLREGSAGATSELGRPEPPMKSSFDDSHTADEIFDLAEFLRSEGAVLQRHRRQRGFLQQHAFNQGYISEPSRIAQDRSIPQFLVQNRSKHSLKGRQRKGRAFDVRCHHAEQLSLT
jgi:hypothetical protein